MWAGRPLERGVPWSLTGTHDQSRYAVGWSQTRVKFVFASMTGWTSVHSQKSGPLLRLLEKEELCGLFLCHGSAPPHHPRLRDFP